jgi:hypothetical protein
MRNCITNRLDKNKHDVSLHFNEINEQNIKKMVFFSNCKVNLLIGFYGKDVKNDAKDLTIEF